jgi:hypothetical protein
MLSAENKEKIDIVNGEGRSNINNTIAVNRRFVFIPFSRNPPMRE